jgi:hypothetical protein
MGTGDRDDASSRCRDGRKRWFEYRFSPGDMRVGTILSVIFWAIIVIIFLYFGMVELRHLKCYTDKQQQCVSPYYRMAPQPGDDNVTLLQRTENGIRLPEEGVNWRRNLIISIVVAVALSILYQRGWPRVGQFILAVVLVYALLFSITNWYEMHVWYRVREQQLRTVDQLRVNLGVLQDSRTCGVYGPSETTGLQYARCSA